MSICLQFHGHVTSMLNSVECVFNKNFKPAGKYLFKVTYNTKKIC